MLLRKIRLPTRETAIFVPPPYARVPMGMLQFEILLRCGCIRLQAVCREEVDAEAGKCFFLSWNETGCIARGVYIYTAVGIGANRTKYV